MSAVPIAVDDLARDTNKAPLVSVEHVSRHFRLDHGTIVRAVDDVSFAIPTGQTLGLVGESGSGKSTLARLLLRLDTPTAGRVLFQGRDLAACSREDLRLLRREMQIVFQDPFAALNRRKTVEQIVSLPLQVHDRELSRAARRSRVSELLELVGLRSEHAHAYPRQLSGGQCQRVSIARALALDPKLIVLDEAVSAVDVSIQAQILNLLRELQQRLGLTYLFVTHDLSVVRYMADTIAVMYLGRIVEAGARDRLFANPQHPYTHALMESIPSPERRARPSARAVQVSDRTQAEETDIPGCSFHPRCPFDTHEVCHTVDPSLRDTPDGHRVACHFPQSSESFLNKTHSE